MRGGRCIRDTRKDRGRKCDCRLCPPVEIVEEE